MIHFFLLAFMLMVFVFIGYSRAAFNQPTKNMLIEVKYCTDTPTLSVVSAVSGKPSHCLWK